MKVAVLYSGGKDSTAALKKVMDRGMEVSSLIAVKPTRTDAYLWHYATVELTKLSAEALEVPLVYIKCEKVGPEEEAKELVHALKGLDADALVIGGVGLQKTQIRAIYSVAKSFGKELILPYEGYTSEEMIKEEIRLGLNMVITSVAANGLDENWLGRRLDHRTIEDLKKISLTYGFDILGEGGHYDTFVLDAPFFKRSIKILDSEKVWDKRLGCGYLDVRKALLVPKQH